MKTSRVLTTADDLQPDNEPIVSLGITMAMSPVFSSPSLSITLHTMESVITQFLNKVLPQHGLTDLLLVVQLEERTLIPAATTTTHDSPQRLYSA